MQMFERCKVCNEPIHKVTRDCRWCYGTGHVEHRGHLRPCFACTIPLKANCDYCKRNLHCIDHH